MESRSTRKLFRAFPNDLGFIRNPQDPLHKLMDITGRQVTLASEYINDQLENLFLGSADTNEPSEVNTSGLVVPLDASPSGNFVPLLQDLATMEVTGFDPQPDIIPEGMSGILRGISYAQAPTGSGSLYIGTSGTNTVYQYDWGKMDEPADQFLLGVETQEFTIQGSDEYLAIQRDDTAVWAVLQHNPFGTVSVIDTINLKAPWDPVNSDGITAPTTEVSLSGQTLWLTSPRPSYVPAVTVSGIITYPDNYQPDLKWESSFIAEYQYRIQRSPYGLTQSDSQHNMGTPGRPIGGSDPV